MRPVVVRPRPLGWWLGRGRRAADLVLVGRRDDGVLVYVPTIPPPAEPPLVRLVNTNTTVPVGSRLARPGPRTAPTPGRAAEERLLRRIAADRGGMLI